DLGDEARLARWLGRAHRRPLPLATRVEALALAGQLHLDAERPAEAVGPLREGLRLAPRDPGLLRRALAAAADADPRVEVTLLEQALDGEIGPEQPSRLDTLVWWRRLARVRATLGDTAEAAHALRQILMADPLDDAAFEDLRAQLEAAEDDAGLAELLHRRLAATDAAGHVPPLDLLRDLMGLAEEVMEEPALAIDCAERLLARDAADRDARAALHRLFERTGHRAGRLKLLRLELADEADDARRAAVAHRLAELAEAPPTDPDALVIARQVLVDLAPDSLDALDALADALQRSGRVGEMAEVLGRRWAVAPTGDNLDVLRARAMALQAVGELDAAEQAWADVLAYHPDDDRVLESLQQVAAARGDHEAVYALFWRRHDVQVDANAAVALLADAAKVAERGLKDADRAAQAWRKVLEWRPHDDQAEQALLRLFVKARDWPALMQLGQERVDRLKGEARLELARKLARLAQDGAADEDTAVSLWQAVHAEAPQDREALEALIGAAERRRDPVTAARLLGRLVQATTNAQDRRDALERRAAVLEGMGDLTGAAEAWAEVRALVPDARAPVSAVRRLAQAQGDHFTAAKALVAELRFVQAPAEALALNQTLARLAAQIGDQLGGLAAWERVRSLAAPGSADEGEALRALKGLYADLGRTDELVRVLRALMERAPDDVTRAAHLLDAAHLLETLRGDHAEAFDCRVRAWRLTPQPPADMLSELRRLADAGGLWARYAEVLGVAQARAASVEAEVAILLERAAVEAESLKAPDRALATAQAAFELDPRDGDAFEAVGRYARETEAWGPWAEALRAVAQRAEGHRRA
ncbi:MAG: hypothetical protein KC613_26550, partial [Myxococcales bacterium]|nr:hypothetical protein [Myxococcales bacterium]